MTLWIKNTENDLNINKLRKFINWFLCRIGLKWCDKITTAELMVKTKQIKVN